jgi:predicted DNA-binding WGR domain protein
VRKPVQLAFPFSSVALRRIDETRNMARFYSMAIERDLFGQVVLSRWWGRLGTHGRNRRDGYAGEGEALAALVVIEAAKRRRGYKDITTPFLGAPKTQSGDRDGHTLPPSITSRCEISELLLPF